MRTFLPYPRRRRDGVGGEHLPFIQTNGVNLYYEVHEQGPALVLASAFIHDPAYLKRTQTAIDYVGLSLLVIGLTCLQFVLDRGERADWFAATWVWVCTSVSLVTLTVFVIREVRVADLILDFRLLTNRTYAVGTTLHTLMGFVLYRSVCAFFEKSYCKHT